MTVPLKQGRSAHEVGEAWNAADASELYEVPRWGKGYFAIGENGHIHVHPTKEPERSIDLKQLIDQLQMRGITLPTLIRFRRFGACSISRRRSTVMGWWMVVTSGALTSPNRP